MILVGRGCLQARERSSGSRAETDAARSLKPLWARPLFPTTVRHYRRYRSAWHRPFPGRNAECDTLIMAGTSFPYMEFLPKPGQAKIIQIDIDPTRIGLRHPAM